MLVLNPENWALLIEFMFSTEKISVLIYFFALFIYKILLKKLYKVISFKTTAVRKWPDLTVTITNTHTFWKVFWFQQLFEELEAGRHFVQVVSSIFVPKLQLPTFL